LFGADDSMMFGGLPINPELNPNCEKDDDQISKFFNFYCLKSFNFNKSLILKNFYLIQ